MTGRYKLETGMPVFTGLARLINYWSKEGNESFSQENLIQETVNYYLKGKFGKGGQTKIYKGKSDGIGKVYSFQNKFEKADSTGAEPRFVIEH